MPLHLPRVIGHRGACAYAPENTIESIRAAAALGVKWVELDVMLTRDDVPVIFHDDTLERTTSGGGNLADHAWDDLRDLDAGSWFADSFSRTRIPTLEQAVEVILDLGLGLNLEIKPTPGREVDTAEVALDALSRIWDDPDSLLISSFQPVSLETALTLAPDWRRGLLLWHDNMPADWQAVADHLDVATVNISDQLADREFIEAIVDGGRMPLVYTINDPRRARQLLGWGADAVFSDCPDAILTDLPRAV